MTPQEVAKHLQQLDWSNCSLTQKLAVTAAILVLQGVEPTVQNAVAMRQEQPRSG